MSHTETETSIASDESAMTLVSIPSNVPVPSLSLPTKMEKDGKAAASITSHPFDEPDDETHEQSTVQDSAKKKQPETALVMTRDNSLLVEQQNVNNNNHKDDHHNNHQPENQENPVPQKAVAVIGSTHFWELAQCPCCRQSFDDHERKINEPESAQRQRHPTRNARQYSLMDRHALSDEEDEDEQADLDEDQNRLAPGILAAGVAYAPTKILVEGWLHKKGTGQDWLMSRAWKARWGRLCLAKIQGHQVEVPLLLMYWYPSSKTPSTAIVLDSTVVVAVDAPDLTLWNAYKFEIRHAVGEWSPQQPVTRTFCAANRAERDAWVYAMAQALLDHAKAQAAATEQSRGRTVRRRRPSPTNTFLSTVEVCRSTSPTPPPPPMSNRPRSPPPPSLPKSPRSLQQSTKKVIA